MTQARWSAVHGALAPCTERREPNQRGEWDRVAIIIFGWQT